MNVLCKNMMLMGAALCLFFAAAGHAAETDYSKAVASKQMTPADVQFLTQGVESIAPIGVPGPLCVYGENAAAVIAGKEGSTNAVLLAAAKYGKGRVAAFGHTGYLGKGLLTQKYGGRLASNIIRWLAAENTSPRIAVIGNQEFADFAKSLGYQGQKLDSIIDPKAIGQFQILVMDANNLPMEQIERISKFVSNGGGLIIASIGWVAISYGKLDLKTEHTGNLLLAPMGIVWADGYLGTTLKKDGVDIYAVSADIPPKLLNVTEALNAIDAREKGQKNLSHDEIRQAVATIERGIRFIPARQAAVLAPLKSYMNLEVIPSDQNKIRKDSMITDVLAVMLQTERYISRQRAYGIPPGGIPGITAANDFPGSVPKDAKIISKSVRINTKIPDWHSTGLYAAPGSIVTVKMPNGFSMPKGQTLSVRIGCHSDGLWGKEEWCRFPEITIEIPCRSETTKVVNPFGGLVYIVVPRNFDNREIGNGEITVRINGCVDAPLFVLGKTSLSDWEKIRHAPAPWGELASDKVILSLPSRYLRDLEKPDVVMEFWNKILDSDAELCGTPMKRNRPERIVCDRQISAGYMHSGYPIMTHLDVEKEFINLHNNPNKGWGFFHEFGHNHQSGDWTFEGTGEVTVNLFTLYNLEQLGVSRETAHPEQKKADKYKKRDDYFAAGSSFEKWKSDPFLALTMYTDLIDKFGWEPFKNVFREYRQLKPEEVPKTDDDKRGQWLVRMSREVKHNLGPYFERWGVPVPQWAKDSVKDLPEWNPY